MKKIKNLMIALIILMLHGFPILPVKAETEAFVIDRYEIELNVKENGQIDVVQGLDVMFSECRHGIYLDIPTQYEMKWTIDGQEVRKKYRFPVSKIKVANHKYDTESMRNGKRIIIGSADKYVNGAVRYDASYTIKTSDLDLNGRQMLYYNIVAPAWNTEIKTVSFEIHMPKSFDQKSINFYFGKYGSESNQRQGFSYEVINSTIYGNLSTSLQPKEGITIQLDLPNEYFSFPKPIDYTNFIIIFSVLLSVATIILFYKYGKDDVVIKSVEFKAPEGLTCAAISYIMDGEVVTNDVLSLIIEWANLGYLSIEEVSAENLRLTKEKDMGDERNRYEKRMFEALFDLGEVVETKDLQEKFYSHLQIAIKDIKQYYSKHKERRVFTQSSIFMQAFCIFIAIVPTFLGMLDSLKKVFYYSFAPALLISFILAVLGILVIVLWWNTVAKRYTRSKGKVVGSFAVSILLGIIYFIIYAIIIKIGSNNQVILIVGIVSTLIISLCALFMDKRTPQGARWYGQILGLKDFIMTAEKDRLVALVHDDPQYFYYILPYAYVLGVSDVWSKKFTDIMMDNATWFKNDTVVPVAMFMPRYYRSMSTLKQLNTMPEIKVSSGGGNFSSGGGGGGFSGGGFGGGGGGSW